MEGEVYGKAVKGRWHISVLKSYERKACENGMKQRIKKLACEGGQGGAVIECQI